MFLFSPTRANLLTISDRLQTPSKIVSSFFFTSVPPEESITFITLTFFLLPILWLINLQPTCTYLLLMICWMALIYSSYLYGRCLSETSKRKAWRISLALGLCYRYFPLESLNLTPTFYKVCDSGLLITSNLYFALMRDFLISISFSHFPEQFPQFPHLVKIFQRWDEFNFPHPELYTAFLGIFHGIILESI